MELYWGNSVEKYTKDLSKTEIVSMPGKYGTKAVASFASFDSRFFTYPSDKRKSAKVPIKIKYADGTSKEYDLYRGQDEFNASGEGQLNTTHAKILLAIIHIWQKQGSKFTGNSNFAVVNIAMRELAQELGYDNSKIGGQLFKWLKMRLKELLKFPNMLDMGNGIGRGFTFVTKIDTWSDKEKYDKTMLTLTFHPFISKQLFERKAFLRNPECYKIKNPTAFKFLICYDKKIFMGNKLKIEIKEAAKDLQLQYKRSDVTVKIFKRR